MATTTRQWALALQAAADWRRRAATLHDSRRRREAIIRARQCIGRAAWIRDTYAI